MNRLRLSFISLALGGSLKNNDDPQDNVLKFPISHSKQDEELRRLFDQHHVPTSMAHPVEFYMSRDLLIELLEASLQTIKENRVPTTEQEGETQYIESAIQQRIDFLDELRHRRDPEIYIALYPVDLEEEARIAQMIEESEDPEDLFPFS